MDRFKVEELKQAAAKADVSLRVFLAGPYIKATGRPPSKAKFNGAAFLRFELYNFLKHDLGADVTLGEHKELKRLYEDHFQHLANAALTELAHVDEQVDLVVLIPSSPGSFSELGLFSIKNAICRKMLILLDKSKKSPPGFIHLGPVSFASKYGSKIEYINYNNIRNAKAQIYRGIRLAGFFSRKPDE
jgi:hypothetical protein